MPPNISLYSVGASLLLNCMLTFYDESSPKFLLPTFPNVTLNEQDPVYKPFAFIFSLLGRNNEFSKYAAAIRSAGSTVGCLLALSKSQCTGLPLPHMVKVYVQLLLDKHFRFAHSEKNSERSVSEEEEEEVAEVPLARLFQKLLKPLRKDPFPDAEEADEFYSAAAEQSDPAAITASDSPWYLEGVDLSLFEDSAAKSATQQQAPPSVEELQQELVQTKAMLAKTQFLLATETVAAFLRGFASKEVLASSDENKKRFWEGLQELGVDSELADVFLESQSLDFESICEGNDKRTEEESLCVVCMTEPTTHVICDCMHFCLCEACAASLMRKKKINAAKCPVCNGKAKNTKRIFK